MCLWVRGGLGPIPRRRYPYVFPHGGHTILHFEPTPACLDLWSFSYSLSGRLFETWGQQVPFCHLPPVRTTPARFCLGRLKFKLTALFCCSFFLFFFFAVVLALGSPVFTPLRGRVMTDTRVQVKPESPAAPVRRTSTLLFMSKGRRHCCIGIAGNTARRQWKCFGMEI